MRLKEKGAGKRRQDEPKRLQAVGSEPPSPSDRNKPPPAKSSRGRTERRLPLTPPSLEAMKTRASKTRKPRSARDRQEEEEEGEGTEKIGLAPGDTAASRLENNKRAAFLPKEPSEQKVASTSGCRGSEAGLPGAGAKSRGAEKEGGQRQQEMGRDKQVPMKKSRGENKAPNSALSLQAVAVACKESEPKEHHSASQKGTEEPQAKETVARKTDLVDTFADEACGIVPPAECAGFGENPRNVQENENLEIWRIERLSPNLNCPKEGNVPIQQCSPDTTNAKKLLKVEPSQQEETPSHAKVVSEDFSDIIEQGIFFRFSSFLGVEPSVSCLNFPRGEELLQAPSLGLVSETENNERQALPSKICKKMSMHKKQIDKGAACSAPPGHQIPAKLASGKLGEPSSSSSILLNETSQESNFNMSSAQPEETAALTISIGGSVAESEADWNSESSVRKQSASCSSMLCSDPFVSLCPLNKTVTWKLSYKEPAAEGPVVVDPELSTPAPNPEVNLMESSRHSLSSCRVLATASHSLQEATQKQPNVKERDASDTQEDEATGGSSNLIAVTQTLKLVNMEEEQVCLNGDKAVHHLLSALKPANSTELVQVHESGRVTARNDLYPVTAERGNGSLGRADTEKSRRADVKTFLSFMSPVAEDTGQTGSPEMHSGTALGYLEQLRDGNVFSTEETWMTNTDCAQNMVGAACRLHEALDIAVGQEELCRLEELETVSLENESEPDQAHSPYLDEMNKGCDDTFSCNKEAKLLLRPYGANLFFKKPVKSVLNTDTQGVPKEKKQPRERKRMLRDRCLSSPEVLPVLCEEQVRGTAVQTLYDVLLKRVQESPDLDVQEETVRRVAGNVEREMFALFPCSDLRYKNKYRSLIFNLRDPKNTHLFRQVVLGEMTPQCLVLMSPIELAPQELVEWRDKEKKRALDIIEKAQRQTQKSQVMKLTHKGLIEVEQAPDQNFSLEDLGGSLLSESRVLREETECVADLGRSCTVQHRSCLLDSDCLICLGETWTMEGVQNASAERQVTPPIQHKAKVRSRRKIAATLRTILTPEGEGRDARNRGRAASWTSIQQKQQVVALWEGSIQMFSIKKFGVKAYLVSGCSSSLLSQVLPQVIESRGFILPATVWEYVDHIWPAEAKAMSLIRFNSNSSRDSQAYTMLYSYLNSKQRYGTVNSDRMDIYIMPLPAFQPIPSKLRSLAGPGLEATHSSLLLALILPRISPSAPAANSGGSGKLKKRKVTFQDQTMGKHQVSSPAHGFQNTKPKQMLYTQSCNLPESLGICSEEPPGLGEQDAFMDCLDEMLWALDREQRMAAEDERPSSADSPSRETIHALSALYAYPQESPPSENAVEEATRSSLQDVLQSLSSSLLLIGQQHDLPPGEVPGGLQGMRPGESAEFQAAKRPPVASSCSFLGMPPSLPLDVLDCNSYSPSGPVQLHDLLHYFSCLGTIPPHRFSQEPTSADPASDPSSSTAFSGNNDDPQQAGAIREAEVAIASVLQSLFSLNSQFQPLDPSAPMQGIRTGSSSTPGGPWSPPAPPEERFFS
ncbi:SPOC domain-containing protein 1 isoform X2 [Rhinatrema bivittatum]|uniref:SPOC domain-containing protein 1 isoform X2 n=1 Tax=Rhinatrema bivittatum TaxID=194408 RepID=UPI00112A6578|nr:SPOC domain-containing protein 1 isoform X2 [Rhinatrema bivittatum]